MKEIKGYTSVLKMTQKQLKKALVRELCKYYQKVCEGDGFVYAKGSKILLTAHMDTVHETPVKIIITKKEKGKTVLSSPQGLGGDDRNGVWAIVNILRTTEYRPSILFCEDEEIGSVGAEKFTRTRYADDLEDMFYLVELDRRNENDAVFYSCGNKEFQDYICDITENKIAQGSFSDICNLSPRGDVASVNLSCGYYKEHQPDTYTVIEEMNKMIEKVKLLLADEKNVTEKFAYKEIVSKYDYFSGSYLTSYYDDYYYDKNFVILSNGMKYEVEAVSEAEAVGYFLMENPDVTYSDIEWIGDEYKYWELFDGFYTEKEAVGGV